MFDRNIFYYTNMHFHKLIMAAGSAYVSLLHIIIYKPYLRTNFVYVKL